VFEFSRPLETRVEGLTAILAAISVGLQKLPALLGEDHCMVALAGDPNRFDQPLLAKMSKVA
jgi:hypothetical protein